MKRSAISRTALWVIIAVVAIVVVVGGVAAYYATRPPPPKPTPTPTPTPTHAIVGQVTIGVVTCLTGGFGANGEQILWGAQLAVSQINSQGGIYLANGPNGPGNYTINLEWSDDQTSTSVGPTALLQLYTTYHPVAVIGSVDTEVVRAEDSLIQQYNIPYFTQCGETIGINTYQNLTPILSNRMIFHDQNSLYYFGWDTVPFLLQYKNQINPSGPIRIGAVGAADDPAFFVDMMDGLEQAINYYHAQNEIQVVDVENLPSYSYTTLQPTLTKFAQEGVNVMFTGLAPPQATALVQQAVDFPQLKGVTTIMWTPEEDVSWYSTINGPDANYLNIFIIAGYSELSNTSVQSLNSIWQYSRDMYLAYTGKPLSDMGAYAMDNVYIIASALQLAGTTNPTAFINAVETLKPSQIPYPLTHVYVPFQPGDTIFGVSSSAGALWHSTNQTLLFIEPRYNPSTQSVYTLVVWPPQYATTQPILTTP